MPKFKYIAMDAKGSEVEDTVEAESQARAVAQIRERGLFPTSVTEVGGRPAANRSRASAVKKVAPVAAPAGGGGLSREIKLPPFLGTLFEGRVRLKQLVVFTRQ